MATNQQNNERVNDNKNTKNYDNTEIYPKKQKNRSEIDFPTYFDMGWMMGLEPNKRIGKAVVGVVVLSCRCQFRCHFLVSSRFDFVVLRQLP